MRIVTLTTDFGAGDFEISTLSGVIWSIAPEVRIVDLSHDVERHNARRAALLLSRAVPYFPAGSIHVVVVDPGVGTGRRPLAARLGEQWFVGPDNGVATLLLRRAQEAGLTVEMVTPDRPQFWLPDVSDIFHGRDVFAPVAAHLAKGAPLAEIGSPLNDPVLLDFPQAQKSGSGWRGQVEEVDHFGNLSTNIHKSHLAAMGAVEVRIAGQTISGLSRTFGEGSPGQLVALIDSSGHLSICVVNGSAAGSLGAKIGDAVEVQPAGAG